MDKWLDLSKLLPKKSRHEKIITLSIIVTSIISSGTK